MTKLFNGILITLLIAAGVSLFVGRERKSGLSQENESLRKQVDQLAELQADNERLSNLLAQPNATVQSQDLARLRRQVSVLRSQTNELGRLQTENKQLRAARAAAGASSGREARATGHQDTVPRDSWVFAGYGNPESTVQSILWAMSQGDVRTVLASFSPEADGFKDMQGKPEDRLAAELKHESEKFTGFKITDKTVLSDDEVILTVYTSGNDDTARVRFQRTANEWKLLGEVKDAASPASK